MACGQRADKNQGPAVGRSFVSVSAGPGQGGCRQGRKMQERPQRHEQQQGMWASPGGSVGSVAGPEPPPAHPRG